LWLLETPSLYENKLLYMNAQFYETKLWKELKIKNLKFFDIICVCVKSMVRKWCDILIIHKKIKKYLCKQKHKFS
jgi:hypothetical protein